MTNRTFEIGQTVRISSDSLSFYRDREGVVRNVVTCGERTVVTVGIPSRTGNATIIVTVKLDEVA